MHLIPIQSSRYSILWNLPLFSVGVLFVLCVASPRKNLSEGPSFVAVASFMHNLGQNHAYWTRKIYNRVFESKNYTHENIGAGHNFRVPMTSVSPYLNPHISAESWRMKTPKPPYLIVALYRFIFRSQKYFCCRLHLQLSWWCHGSATSTSFKLKSKMDLKIFLRPANCI